MQTNILIVETVNPILNIKIIRANQAIIGIIHYTNNHPVNVYWN